MNNDTTKKPKVIFLDSTALQNSACMRRVFLMTWCGYTSKLKYNDIEFGTAIHQFKYEMRHGKSDSFLIGLQRARNYYKTKPMIVKKGKEFLNEPYLINICNAYYERYKDDSFEPIFVPATAYELEQAKELEALQSTDPKILRRISYLKEPKPLTEMKFSFPVYADGELIVILCGIMDEVGKFKNGCYSISDLKNTSMWNVNSYFDSYRLSSQLLFYRWIIKKSAELYPNSIFPQIHSMDCGAFIDG